MACSFLIEKQVIHQYRAQQAPQDAEQRNDCRLSAEITQVVDNQTILSDGTSQQSQHQPDHPMNQGIDFTNLRTVAQRISYQDTEQHHQNKSKHGNSSFLFCRTPANTDRARHNFLFFTYTIQQQITHNTNPLRYVRKIKRPYRPDDFHILLSI